MNQNIVNVVKHLKEVGHRSYAEIADRVGLSINEVKTIVKHSDHDASANMIKGRTIVELIDDVADAIKSKSYTRRMLVDELLDELSYSYASKKEVYVTFKAMCQVPAYAARLQNIRNVLNEIDPNAIRDLFTMYAKSIDVYENPTEEKCEKFNEEYLEVLANISDEDIFKIVTHERKIFQLMREFAESR